MGESNFPAGAQSIIELGKMFENLNATEKRLYELKVEKGQLEHDVAMFQSTRAQEKEAFQKEKASYEAQILDFKNIIASLEHKKNELSIEINSEMGKIAVIKNKLKDEEDSLRARKDVQTENEKAIQSKLDSIEKKKDILNKIKELHASL